MAPLFALSDRHGFVIASDECYSEIYFRDEPPLGGLEAAVQLGRSDFRNLVAFTSLSKRSNVPGMRSGFVAGDAALILKPFLLYRTYHGSAMSPAGAAPPASPPGTTRPMWWPTASCTAPSSPRSRRCWPVLDVALPDAGFYLWAGVPRPVATTSPSRQGLLAQYNVTVLPGSLLARDAAHGQPGHRPHPHGAGGPGVDECLEAAQRIVAYTEKPSPMSTQLQTSSTWPGKAAPRSPPPTHPRCARRSSTSSPT
jgi:N-succinyldiaminopimelate aminotransferase